MASCLVVATAVTAVTAAPAAARNAPNPLAGLKGRQAQVQVAIDLARASDARVEAEAGRLAGAVAVQQTRLARAQAAGAASAIEIADGQRRTAALVSRAAATKAAVVARAVAAYTHPFQDQFSLVSDAGNLDDYARRQAYLQALNGRDSDALDAYRQSRIELAIATRQLQRTEALAAARAQAASGEARLLATAQASAQSAHAELAGRIADLQTESRDLAAQESSLEALIQRQAALAAPRSGLLGSLGSGRHIALIWPVHGPVTSEFGPRWGGFHPGMDIAPPYGTPIHAAAAGVVIFAGWYGGYGNFVVVDHGDGISTAYAHQSQIAVAQGQAVSQGQVIGYEGSTGDSTGPHVHFEVRVNGAPQNPRNYVPGSP